MFVRSSIRRRRSNEMYIVLILCVYIYDRESKYSMCVYACVYVSVYLSVYVCLYVYAYVPHIRIGFGMCL